MLRKPAKSADRATPLLRERVRRLFRHLPHALAGDEEEIHQMRIAGRRLRVALPLLARKPEGRRVGRALKILRLLTRAGGFGRDLDVGVSLLDQRLSGLDATRERKLLRRSLRSARGRSRATLASALMDVEIAKLRRHLRAIVERRADGAFSVLLRLRELRESSGSFLEELQLETERYDPVALHRLRRRTRGLRYAAELSDAFRGQETAAAALLKSLQDWLGRSHDFDVLARWLELRAARASSAGDAPLAREAHSLAAHFHEQSRKQHREFVAADPAALARRAVETLGPPSDSSGTTGGLECAS
jgi:CHAD domain-containing protein